jgi:ribosomal protein S18 acetylase RimI-like enzyme
VRIRRARPEDARSIAQGESLVAATPGLLNALPGEIPDQAFADKIVALEDCTNGLYLVAEQGDEIVGHLLLDPMPLAANSHICTLTLVVYPKWQGRGFGRQLLVHALQWARTTLKVEKIELMVRATNERAVHLYQSLGFLEEGRIRKRVKAISDVYHDDIAMGLFMQRPGA